MKANYDSFFKTDILKSIWCTSYRKLHMMEVFNLCVRIWFRSFSFWTCCHFYCFLFRARKLKTFSLPEAVLQQQVFDTAASSSTLLSDPQLIGLKTIFPSVKYFFKFFLPSRGSPVWTERHRRPPSPRLSVWASPRCSRARPAAPPGGAGAWARSWWVAWCLQTNKRWERKVVRCAEQNTGVKFSSSEAVRNFILQHRFPVVVMKDLPSCSLPPRN